MREHHDEIAATGAEIVLVGTGDQRYATAFVRDEQIPFLVLVDDDATAASAAAVRTNSFASMFHPRTWRATRQTMKRGYRIHKAGKRVTQMGATFVIGPGAVVHYQHVDADSVDHAPIPDVLESLRART